MGCILDEDNEIYFLHNPKTAGQSIKKVFNCGKKDCHSGNVEEGCENYFVFTFVRNPWDRLYSAFKYNVRMGEAQNWKKAGRNKYEQYKNSFESFVLEFSHKAPNLNIHFRSQDEWYTNNHLDFVGRFENLKENFELITSKFDLNLDLPKENETSGKNYEDVYTEKMKEKVYKIYKQDIENLDYNF